MTGRRRRRVALPLALLLLAAVLPALGSSQTPTSTADGAVTDLTVVGPAPAWVDGMPTPTRLEATVRNTGSTPISYTIAYYWNDTTFPLNGDTPSSTDGSRTPLAPGATAKHGVDWTPLPGQAGDGQVLAIVTVGADRDPSNNAFSLGLAVPVRDVRLSWSGDGDRTVREDETRFFRLTVENHGLQAQQFSATPVPSTGGLTAEAEPDVLAVPAGSSASFDLYVHRPKGSAPPPVNYTVTLHDLAAPDWVPRSPPLIVEPVATPLDAGELATTLRIASGVPRSAGAFDVAFEVANTGNSSDSVALSVAGPHGWGEEVQPQRLALLPGERGTVHVTGSAPLDAVPGSLAAFTVEAHSERGPAGDAAAVMSVRATGPAVDLSALTFPEQVYEGDTATANLTITNVGDRPMPASLVVLGSDPSVEGLDDPFPVPALAVGGRWQASMPFLPARDEPVFLPGAFAVLDTSKDGHVQADEGVYVALRPDAPSQGFEHPAGGGTLGAGDVRLNATGRASGSQVVNGSKERDLGSGPLLPLDGRLWCTDLDGDGRCHPGDTMYLNLMDEGGLQQVVSSGDLRLTARGALHAGSRVLANEADTGADLVPWGGWALAFADRNGNGAFDAAEPMYLDRGDHAVGPEDVRLTILTGARGVVVAPFGSWVAAGDLDDGTRLAPGPFGTTVVDGVLGPVSVGGIWVVEDGSLPGLQIPTASLFVRTARLQATAPAAFNAAPGESLDLGVPPGAFQVANLGNAPEEIRILAEASSGHVALPGGDLVGLAPGESRIVPVHVDLPLSAGAATVELRLTAWLEHHPATQATAVVQVALPDLTPPSVAFAGMPAVWDPGRPLLVALNASDDVGVASVAVVAQTAGGTPVPAAARLDDDGLWRVEMALSPGNYTLRALATDVSNRTAGAIPVAVEIRQVPPPDLLRLVPADGAVVWPSDPVLVSLHDPTGISEASLRVDGGPARALEVDSQGSDTLFLHGNLTGLAAGRHTLAFAAVNGAGRSWERTITVNSAPSGAAPSSAPPAKDSPAGAVPLFGLALLLLAAGRRPRKPWDTK